MGIGPMDCRCDVFLCIFHQLRLLSFCLFRAFFALSFDFSVVGYDTVLQHFDHEKAVEEGSLQNLHACQGEERQEELREEKKREKGSQHAFVCPMRRTTEMFMECMNFDWICSSVVDG